jgi:hypothetical protein
MGALKPTGVSFKKLKAQAIMKTKSSIASTTTSQTISQKYRSKMSDANNSVLIAAREMDRTSTGTL